MKIIFVLVAIGLTGCAWTHPTATQADFARDKYECLREASYVQPPVPYIPSPTPAFASPAGAFLHGLNTGLDAGQAWGGPRVNQNMFRACMEARGYR